MVKFNIEQKQAELLLLLNKYENLDMTLIHSDLGVEATNIIEERFDKGVDPRGRKWKKIKKYFNRDANRFRFPSDTPLKLNVLYLSFSSDANSDRVLVGTPEEYAKYHTDAPMNNGAGRRKIPLREFMGFVSQPDISRLLDVVLDNVKFQTA